MKSINYTLLGDESLVKEFGKKGTTTDLTIYGKKDSKIPAINYFLKDLGKFDCF
jgi:hypothetical protein